MGLGFFAHNTRDGANSVKHWPKGFAAATISPNGPNLVVTNGQTVSLTEGQTYDYESIDIQAGGTLNVSQSNTNGFVIIGCRGLCKINGTLAAYNFNYNGAAFWSATDPLGKTVSYTRNQNLGGAGGHSGYADYFIPVQASWWGPGAGPSAGVGGTGGNTAPMGATHTLFGGSGGAQGPHGSGIYLYVKSGNITGTGNIYSYGFNGTSGNPGQDDVYGFNDGAGGGGGGGGGAGGTGGYVLIRAFGGTVNFSPNVNMNAGSGGAGGAGGAGYPIENGFPSKTENGQNGINGNAGYPGTYVLQNT